MTVTLEISLYPLKDEYESDIIPFIQSLNSNSEIQVYTNAMSTYVKGDWEVVNNVMSTALESLWSKGGTSSTVMKIIPRDLPVETGFFRL
ncbi:MAG: hypothetical protein HKN68_09715 [Saprospiraceae bacterium]|nr:hypothetical protein [Saprospiraceae bacterium]